MYKKSGFTLIELSIVLVIIALIISGVIVGRDVLDNANRQKVITDINTYKTAVGLFKDKYEYLPGDFPFADDYWTFNLKDDSIFISDAVASNSNPLSKKLPYMGDGQVGGPGSNFFKINPDEALLVWVHLVAAGLIEGNYNGNGPTYDPGVNVPLASYKNGGYHFSFLGTAVAATAGAYEGRYGHSFTYGSAFDTNGVGLSIALPLAQPLITGVDAFSIDSKGDDGMPGTGAIRTFTTEAESPVPTCATSDVAVSAQYAANEVDPLCSLIFISGF